MNTPYIHVSKLPRLIQLEHRDNGVIEPPGDFHAVFGAEIPFIPSFRSADFMVPGNAGQARIDLIVRRQHRLLNDLVNSHEITPGKVSFDLRYVSQPSIRWTGRSTIRIFLFGKVSHHNSDQVGMLGQRLWKKLASHFPQEDPFGYPLTALDQSNFDMWKTPLDLGKLRQENLIEVRKYVELDPLVGDGYFPHPFEPTLDFSALGRFLETLSNQSQPTVVSMCIRPTMLNQAEIQELDQMLGRYAAVTNDLENGGSWLLNQRTRHIDSMRVIVDSLLNQRHHLFQLKIQVLGANHPPMELVDALGSELVRNDQETPRRWAHRHPGSNDDLRIALRNFRWLEHEPWGDDLTNPLFSRLRDLASTAEALGAFRLPIPSIAGFLPGIRVHDEPFVLPNFPDGKLIVAGNPTETSNAIPGSETDRHSSAKRIGLGNIIHRGQPSGVEHCITLEDLNRHSLIAGVTGSGKTTTCLHLLSQLWDRHHVPFLVLYPIDKPDYRQLLADKRVADDLLIFTVGDENTAPFRFNPFAVPNGILLRTHMSRLLRCFSAAYVLADPLPAVYRAALRMVYNDAGWNLVAGIGGGNGAGTVPTLSDFYDAIVRCAEEMTTGYGNEVKGNIRQASEIRIGDLRDNLGHVLDVTGTASFAELLTKPTVMELGRLGSPEDTALIMAFLLTLVSEEVECRSKRGVGESSKGCSHLTLVEEAHRLMAGGQTSGHHTANPRATGGDDFANLLAEVRGYGEGIMIAEQIPSSLIQSAIGNTQTKIMHRLEDTTSFDLFSDILNLDERQRDYARALGPGEILVRSESGEPVHVKVANYSGIVRAQAEERRQSGLQANNMSDHGIAELMANRYALPRRNDLLHSHLVDCWADPISCFDYRLVLKIPEEDFQQDSDKILAIARNESYDRAGERMHRICHDRIREQSALSDPWMTYSYFHRIGDQRRPKFKLWQAFPTIGKAIAQLRDEGLERLNHDGYV